MKFSAATLFAAGAAAATMGKRSTAYEVTDFYASCTQHSVQCKYVLASIHGEGFTSSPPLPHERPVR